jgi:hypothetical protein
MTQVVAIFLYVDSGNRHAVRRLLTRYGHKSIIVRDLRNDELEKHLAEGVMLGKIPLREVSEFCFRGANQKPRFRFIGNAWVYVSSGR